MALLAPPPPPPTLVTLDDYDRLRRVRFRLWQIVWVAMTVFATAWCCTLGWIPGIVALMVAKHVLVAILMIGLHRDAGYRVRL